MTFEAMWPEHWLPRAPLAGDVKDPEHPSLRRRSRTRALDFPHIEANPLVLRSLVVVDHDGAGADHAAELAGLPAPSRVTLNPWTTAGHIEYALRRPVILTDAANRAPVNLLARVEHGLVDVLGGDVAYAGRITKNPQHSTHVTVWGPTTALYGLRDLATALDDLGALPSAGHPRRNVSSSAVGRNVALFDATRKWSYRRRGDYTSRELWERAVFAHAWEVNETVVAHEFTAGPLSANEVSHLARSVARWTWRKIQRTFAEEQARRGRKGGRATAANGGRERLIEMNKTRGPRHDRAAILEADRGR
ncbi:replication initiation protein [Cellulosimicrobium sp. NPDC057862]|uniref:replication initiation protein n=1 Tax=Actinomycetes TaxID=1760 RepID=UPI00366B5A28